MIQTVGIIGSGKMGSDIFNYLSDFNFRLKWFILDQDEKDKLEKSYHKKIARKLKHGLINDEQFKLRESDILSTNLLDFNDCDLIIESIPEKIELKQIIFIKLNYILHKNCLLASNSSSILPSRLSKSKPVYGLHFFYPVAFKNTVELINSTGTVESVEKIKDFLSSVNKIVFKQDEKSAFLLNRFLLDIQLKAFDLVNDHGIDYIHFDKIVHDLIPDFGVFEIIDSVGLETMYYSVYNYAQMDVNPNRYNVFLDEIMKKIQQDVPFCNKNDDESIKDDLKKYIYNDIKYFTQTLIKEYVEKFKLDEEFFRSAVNDFCGFKA